MTNTATVNDVNEIKKIKTNAIIYSITTALWFITSGIVLYGSLSVGNKPTWAFWTDISIAVVFGTIAIEKFIKYAKEKKAAERNVVVE